MTSCWKMWAIVIGVHGFQTVKGAVTQAHLQVPSSTILHPPPSTDCSTHPAAWRRGQEVHPPPSTLHPPYARTVERSAIKNVCPFVQQQRQRQRQWGSQRRQHEQTKSLWRKHEQQQQRPPRTTELQVPSATLLHPPPSTLHRLQHPPSFLEAWTRGPPSTLHPPYARTVQRSAIKRLSVCAAAAAPAAAAAAAVGQEYDVLVDQDRTAVAAAGGQRQHRGGLAKKMSFTCPLCFEECSAANGCVGRAAAALCVQ